MIIAIPIIIVVAVIVLWYISTSNNFKRAKIKIEESLSGIEVALTKRYDTLSKMLDATKGYMKHEQDTFAQIVQMRKGMSVGEMNEAARQMDEVTSQIRVTAEAYPELRSSDLFVQLQRGIADVEEHLQAARRLYNANVSRFNTMKEVFPSNLLGKNYEKYDFSEAEESKRVDVEMKFN